MITPVIEIRILESRSQIEVDATLEDLIQKIKVLPNIKNINIEWEV